MERIEVVYGVVTDHRSVESRAREIALEQTVEIPEQLVPAPMLEDILASVKSIEPDGDRNDRFRVTLAYPVALSSFQLPQLLNLIYGNISIQPGIRIEGLTLPPSLLSRFKGPRYGIPGIRALLGTESRPLLATALKPRGSTAEELAKFAGDFARGGGDLVKDDHNLVDASAEAFRSRTLRCRDAVESANSESGGRTIYLPCVCPSFERLESDVEFLVDEGIRGMLIPPLLLGLDLTRSLLERHDLIAFAHPTFSGPFTNSADHGIAHPVFLGTLMRLIGADASIFPNHGGRFSFQREECQAISRELVKPIPEIRSSFPAPAGGMSFDRLGEMAKTFGNNAIMLIGGALLGHSSDLSKSTEAFIAELERVSEP